MLGSYVCSVATTNLQTDTWDFGGANWTTTFQVLHQSWTEQPGSHQRWESQASHIAALTEPDPDHPFALLPALGQAGTKPCKSRSVQWRSLCSHLGRSAEMKEKVVCSLFTKLFTFKLQIMWYIVCHNAFLQHLYVTVAQVGSSSKLGQTI